MRVTLDPNFSGDNIRLSNRNLTASMSLSETKANFVRATHGVSSGKWYFEAKYKNGTNTIGIVSKEAEDVNHSAVFHDYSTSTVPLTKGSGVCWFSNNIRLNGQITATSDIVSPRTDNSKYFIEENSIIGIAIDMITKTVSFYKNGIFQESISNIPDKTFYPAIGINGNTSDKLKDREVSINFGEFGFKYPIPEGYRPYYEIDYKPVIHLDSNCCGSSIKLSNNGMTATMSGSTPSGAFNFVRATKGVSTGIWYWEINVKNYLPTYFGVVSKDADEYNTGCLSYKNTSYGKLTKGTTITYSGDGNTYSCKDNITAYNSFPIRGTTIGVVLNTEDHLIGLMFDGVTEPISVTNIPDMEFFPYFGFGSNWLNGTDSVAEFNFGEHGFKYPIPDRCKAYYLANSNRVITSIPSVSLDPAIKWTGMDLSDNNLMITTNSNPSLSNSGGFVRATHGASTGKWYFEVEVIQDGAYLTVGIISDCNADFNKVAGFTDKWNTPSRLPVGSGVSYVCYDTPPNQAYITTTNDIDPNSPVTELNPTWVCSAGDIVGVAFNMDDHAIAFYRNGTHLKTVFNLGNEKYFAGITSYYDTSGNSGTMQCRVNFGDKPFRYFIHSGVAQYNYLAYEKIAETYRPLVRLDTNYKGYGIQLLDRHLTAYLGGLQYQKTDIANFVRVNYGVRHGKWYWEVYKNLPGGTSIGIVSRDTVDKDTDYNLGNDAAMNPICVTGTASSVISAAGAAINTGYLQNTNDFPVHVDEASTSYFYDVGGTIGIVMDVDNKMLYYYNNNNLIRNFAMPASGKEMFAAVGEFIGLFGYALEPCNVTFNFGEEAPFKYPIPQENTKPYYLAYDRESNLKIY